MYLSLVLAQPRKTRPCLTERLLMGSKESNQTKTKQKRNVKITMHESDTISLKTIKHLFELDIAWILCGSVHIWL